MMSFSACNDETLEIGNTLTGQTDKLTVSSAKYDVLTRTVLADSVLLRNSYCYLGRVKDPETGAYVTSEFMSQFNILETFSLPSADKVVSSYNGQVAVDSCQIELYMESPTGITDTLAAMKIRASEMIRPMEESQKYFSNFDPVAEGFITNDVYHKDKMFSYNDLTVKDSIRNISGYLNVINIKLNHPYTDKNGVTYNNYGTYIMQQYYQHPEYFKNSYTFVHNVCPGFFFSVTDGEGVYTRVPDMCIRLYYQIKDDNDSVSVYGTALAGTEEVLQTTKITNETDVLRQMTTDNTCTYLKAPAGLYTEVTLPIDEIFSGHEKDSVMTAKVSFQRINNNYYDKALQIPQYLIMVPKDSLYSFFENQKMPDNKLTYSTSFTQATNQYSFTNISALITLLAEAKRKGQNENANWTATHPDWNKVLLIPVSAITSSSSSTTSVTGFEHCVNITSTKLVGGSENPYEPIKLNVVYAKFNE